MAHPMPYHTRLEEAEGLHRQITKALAVPASSSKITHTIKPALIIMLTTST